MDNILSSAVWGSYFIHISNKSQRIINIHPPYMHSCCFSLYNPTFNPCFALKFFQSNSHFCFQFTLNEINNRNWVWWKKQFLYISSFLNKYKISGKNWDAIFFFYTVFLSHPPFSLSPNTFFFSINKEGLDSSNYHQQVEIFFFFPYNNSEIIFCNFHTILKPRLVL